MPRAPRQRANTARVIIQTLIYTIILPACIIGLVLFVSSMSSRNGGNLEEENAPMETRYFQVQSIDTMQDSRDRAREVEKNPAAFDAVIERDMTLISHAGATHVAIDTPYDPEFSAVLKRWVDAARTYGLSVWFRGNFSGWEGWFGYASITPATHLSMLRNFITSNAELFENGDIFTPCPECENGGPGDPRKTGDARGYDDFLVAEHQTALSAFGTIGKDVSVYASMNKDIASDILTKDTAAALGGTILIDHYAPLADDYALTIDDLSSRLSARIGIGEFGAPIPNINGAMTDKMQAAFVGNTLTLLAREKPALPLVNYWSIENGSTALVNENGKPKDAYGILADYFKPIMLSGTIKDPTGTAVPSADVSINGVSASFSVENGGSYNILVPSVENGVDIEFSKAGYAGTSTTIRAPDAGGARKIERNIVLAPSPPSLWYGIETFIRALF
jgi:hypothetical protein